VHKADNLTTILCRCHEIWEPLTSWNPLSHSRPVTVLIYVGFVTFLNASSWFSGLTRFDIYYNCHLQVEMRHPIQRTGRRSRKPEDMTVVLTYVLRLFPFKHSEIYITGFWYPSFFARLGLCQLISYSSTKLQYVRIPSLLLCYPQKLRVKLRTRIHSLVCVRNVWIQANLLENKRGKDLVITHLRRY
jgi:hypothetical protein